MSHKQGVLRRLQHLHASFSSSLVAQEDSGLIRMGSCLNVPGKTSDDPLQPSPDVGTVKLFENERVRVWDMCVR